jgi:hypothetical protein
MIHQHGRVVQPPARDPPRSSSALSRLVGASEKPANVERTGHPAGAWLTEAEPEEGVLSLDDFTRSAEL